jgi:hypothetical protein
MTTNRWTTFIILAALFFFVAGCAPGNLRWDKEIGQPANFWAGLWHGLIIIVTFIVSLFTQDVKIYEVNNVGWAYNLGFLLGAMISLGGGARSACHRKHRDPDWDKVGKTIGDGIREGLESWRTERPAEPAGPDWDELGRRIEQRVREELAKGRKD